MAPVDWTSAPAPSLADLVALAEEARAALPPAFRQAADQIALHVVDFADAAMLRDLGIDDAFDLTGLYDGIPLTQRSTMDQPDRLDAIWLFRRPILDEWVARDGETLGHLVAHVFVHELAHHFGWSDAEIARIAPWRE